MVTDGFDTTLDLQPAFDPAGFRFIDINGDGRADWIYMHNTTTTDIRINQRGDRSDGEGLKPHWRSFSNQIQGWPNDPGVTRDHLLFGRMFGSGRNDLVRMVEVGDNFDYVFHFHRNTGKGGKEVRGDGVQYCDMFGQGHDKYASSEINSVQTLTYLVTCGLARMAQSSCSSRFDSSIYLYTDEHYINTSRLKQHPPSWLPHGQILDVKRDRKFIHLGDWDGDGLCDVLAVDRTTGNVDMFRNTYKKDGKVPTFNAPIRVANGTLCPQPILNGNLFDLAVRFGDLDGDGRVDVRIPSSLCPRLHTDLA
jgi:hypothetical protein